eukprot:Skav220352  [mRNA]  locus=scaffold5657:3683:5100:+ [translate_table: standard]
MHADTALENICALGVLDGDALRDVLQRYDFDDERRWQLQRSYESLKRDCGHRVPHYGAHSARMMFVPLCC